MRPEAAALAAPRPMLPMQRSPQNLGQKLASAFGAETDQWAHALPAVVQLPVGQGNLQGKFRSKQDQVSNQLPCTPTAIFVIPAWPAWLQALGGRSGMQFNTGCFTTICVRIWHSHSPWLSCHHHPRFQNFHSNYDNHVGLSGSAWTIASHSKSDCRIQWMFETISGAKSFNQF